MDRSNYPDLFFLDVYLYLHLYSHLHTLFKFLYENSSTASPSITQFGSLFDISIPSKSGKQFGWTSRYGFKLFCLATFAIAVAGGNLQIKMRIYYKSVSYPDVTMITYLFLNFNVLFSLTHLPMERQNHVCVACQQFLA